MHRTVEVYQGIKEQQQRLQHYISGQRPLERKPTTTDQSALTCALTKNSAL